MIAPVIDKLHIFVSSTIKECSAERAVVRDAIRSINHDPILFEDIGARPHPPRELYKARLEMSQLFVAIYKESYGWVAPDMDISGVEDEFRLARARGIDRLVYVYQTPSTRDPRLEQLIEQAKNDGITVAGYSDPEQLRDRVRNDLTAVISERFVEQAVVSREAPNPEEVIESLVPNPAHRMRRPDVEADLIDRLNKWGRVVVAGPIGSGKTILLAQLSAEARWVFVDGHGLNRLDVLARAANSVRRKLGLAPLTLVTEQAAIESLVRSSQELPELTLAVDGASEPLVFWDIPRTTQRLVVTSRSALPVPSDHVLELRKLTADEVVKWSTVLRGNRPAPGELSSLVDRSDGNPLYLRFFALGAGQSQDLSLQELEIRALDALPPRAREITSYLALSPRPLSFGDLNALAGDEQGPEALASQLSSGAGLVRQIREQVTLVHEHLRTTAIEQLRQTPARLAFFAGRLGRYFEQSQRYVAAFHVFMEGDEQRHADRILDRAANQAALMGGGAPAIPIFRRQAERAERSGSTEGQLYALLALAFAFHQTGAKEDAGHSLSQAQAIAERSGEPSYFLKVKEMAAVVDVGDRPRSERIAELVDLRSSYTANGDAFNAARTGTLLTAEYISGADYRRAESVSRDVLNVFDDIGDEYGIRIARLNLAAALSGIGGREEEAAAIARDLQHELDPDEFPRERAVLCNYLTRHYRESGDTARAAEFALEAIHIGEQLGDQHVIAINRTTLGNVRRDEGNLDHALIEYHTAEQVSAAAGLRDTESAANELIASVHNERGEYGIALHHAQHASTLARKVGDEVLIARAEEERAIALAGQREVDLAVAAYIAAARAIAVLRPGGSFFISLVGDALHLCATTNRIDLKVQLLMEIFSSESKPQDGSQMHPLRALYAALPEMPKMIGRVNRLLPIVSLAMADLLADVPVLVERRIILQSMEALFPREGDIAARPVLGTAAAILMAHSGNCLTLSDVVEIGERLAQQSRRIYFKPHSDGTGHWTVRLEIGSGVVVSLLQLDDSAVTASTTAILALLLASLDGAIRQRLLNVERLPRDEVIINVANRTELETQLGPELLKLGEMPNGFAVAESTDVTRTDQPPILVICAEGFPTPWRPDQHALSDLHLMFGEVLRVMVGHVLAKALEPEVLAPKIGRLVRGFGYRGQAVHVHPRQ